MQSLCERCSLRDRHGTFRTRLPRQDPYHRVTMLCFAPVLLPRAYFCSLCTPSVLPHARSCSLHASSVLPSKRPCSLSRTKAVIHERKFRVYNIYKLLSKQIYNTESRFATNSLDPKPFFSFILL